MTPSWFGFPNKYKEGETDRQEGEFIIPRAKAPKFRSPPQHQQQAVAVFPFPSILLNSLSSFFRPALIKLKESIIKQMARMVVDGENRLLGFPYWNPVRRKFEPNAPFFASGNIERELLAKQVAVDLTEDEKYQLQNMADAGDQSLYCPIVGCGARLNSLEDFEGHYHARHTASCSVCSRVYPTSRLLSIHVSEAHDSFFQAKVARGFPMYECLVEGCGMKLKSYKSRQQHLVDKHKFPTSFEFFKKAQPSKKYRQKRHLRKKADNKGEEEDTGMDVDETIDGLVSAVSKLSTSDSSPSTVSFGRRHNRGFTFLPRAVLRDRKPNSSEAAGE